MVLLLRQAVGRRQPGQEQVPVGRRQIEVPEDQLQARGRRTAGLAYVNPVAQGGKRTRHI